VLLGPGEARLIKPLRACLSLAFAVTILTGCVRDPPLEEKTGILLGTVVTAKTYLRTGKGTPALLDAAFAEMSRIDSLCGYLESSEIQRINANTGHPVRISREITDIILKSLRYSELSRGALDVTIDPVLRLYNRFEGGDMGMPSKASVESSCALVDYRSLVVTDTYVMLSTKGGSIDLGALAKGYAVDRGAAVMESLGASGGLVDAGGDIKTFGMRPDGKPWRIGLKDPRVPDSIVTVFELEGGAVATSGDYERYFIEEGVRYHHILDPRTGFPARGCCSVTVIAELSCDADAIATAVFVLGPEEGLELVESLPGVEALILVCENGIAEKVFRSSGLNRYEK
jgi:thiamine biosynthesis lipoprotein